MRTEIYTGGFYKTNKETFLEVFDSQDGYEYLIYDSALNEIDGGLLATQEWLEEDWVVKETLLLAGYSDTKYTKMSNIPTMSSCEELNGKSMTHTPKIRRKR